jgi:hypothetical protein
MDSINSVETLSQLQNLDPVSKQRLQEVITQESQKATLQQSSPPSNASDLDIHKHADLSLSRGEED